MTASIPRSLVAVLAAVVLAAACGQSVGRTGREGDVAPSELPGDAAFWLGESWDPGGRLPVVVLTGSEEPQAQPGPDALFDYALQTEAQGFPVIMVGTWKATAWDAMKERYFLRPCPGAAPSRALRGTAHLLCSAQDGMGALVDLGSRVVLVAALTNRNGGNGAPQENPFSSASAMKKVLSSLRAK